MKKRIFTFLFLLIFCISAAIPAFAESLPRLVDNGDLLTASEESLLLTRLNGLSEHYGMDVVVVTVDSTGFKNPRDYADDFYDNNGYRPDGVLLLVSMDERDWWISTSGSGITAFTDAGIEYLGEQFAPELSDENYAGAFGIFADQCDAFLAQAATGDPFDSHNLPKAPFNWVLNLVIAVAIGFIVALIVTAVMKSSLKSVRSQPAASNYVRPGSMNLTVSREFYLYSHVSKTAKPKQSSGSSTHVGSSGRSHGGGGGKF